MLTMPQFHKIMDNFILGGSVLTSAIVPRGKTEAIPSSIITSQEIDEVVTEMPGFLGKNRARKESSSSEGSIEL